jgi:hypothetical protein
MKKRTFLYSIFGAFLSLLALSSCGGKSIQSDCYFFEKGTGFGDCVNKISLTVNKGTIVSGTLSSTYSPCVWARVDPNEKSDSEIETFQVDDANLLDGTSGTIHLAKYIRFGTGQYSFDCVGSLRNPDDEEQAPNYNRGDYVEYDITAIGGTSVDLKVKELKSYLDTTEDDNNFKLGSSIKHYYDALAAKDVHVLGHAKGATDLTVNTVEYTPYIPEGKVLRNDLSAFSSWTAAAGSFCSFLAGKKLDYKSSVKSGSSSLYSLETSKDGTGTYIYNPYYAQGDLSKDDSHWLRVEGCTSAVLSLSAMEQFFISANIAFAYVEYDSLR